MDRTKARWRFEFVSDEYGTRVSLIDPSGEAVREYPASAVIGTDWDAKRIATTLEALEAIYEALPEPEENA